MKNFKIKEALKKYGMKQWELADLLGISETGLSKKMRYELPSDVQNLYVNLIKQHFEANTRNA